MSLNNPDAAGVEPDMDADPVVTDYSPRGSADVNGGETVTITGSSFLGTTAVALGPYAGYFAVVSDTEIQFTAPPYGSSVVENPASARLVVWKDSRASSLNAVDEWTWGGQNRQELQGAYGQAEAAAAAAEAVDPVVSDCQPAGSESANGGDNCVINGTGFFGASSVAVGPFPVYFTVASDEQILFTAPAYDASVAAGVSTAKLTVWNGSRQSDTDGLAEWTWAGQSIEQLNSAGTALDSDLNPVAEAESTENDAEQDSN